MIRDAGRGLGSFDSFGHRTLPYEPGHVYEVELTGVAGGLTFRPGSDGHSTPHAA